MRRRLVYVAVSVGVWTAAAYGVQHHIVDLLLRPSHGQSFIYTSPGGGIDFLFRVCLYTGIIFSIPVIVYQVLKYIEPVVKGSLSFVKWGSILSGVLALAGMAFGYFIGLPSALHFLLHQFTTLQVKPLVTIQSYMSFVMVYMFGSALLFQIPLIVLFINRIKPLKPKSLFKLERWVILGSFVMSGLMNPSPNVLDQLMVAGPMVLMYQVAIVIVACVNRPRRSKAILSLLEHDNQVQAARLSRARSAHALPMKQLAPGPVTPLSLEPKYSPAPQPALAPTLKPALTAVEPRPVAVARPAVALAAARTAPPAARSQKYMNGFIDFHQRRAPAPRPSIDRSRLSSAESEA